MNLQFVGTASAIAEPERVHSSFLIKEKENIALFDCGEGVSAALAKLEIPVRKINSIIISHFHADHIAGLPLLITQMKIYRREEKLTLFVHHSLVETLKTLLRLFYHFPDKMNFELEIIPFDFDEEFNLFGNIKVLARQNKHLFDKYGDEESGKVSFVSSGFLICNQINSIYFTSDISSPDELNLFKDKSPNFLITEAAHISIDDIIENYQLSKYTRVFLTHYPSDLKERFFEKIESAKLAETILLSEDGMEINI
jgi:ribonuclease BN (tRNA processing enzyme)